MERKPIPWHYQNLSEIGLHYDTADRRTAVVFGNGSAQGYSWEADGDLVGMSHAYPSAANDNVTMGWTHDLAGRQTGETLSNSAYAYGLPPADVDAYGAATALNTYPSVDGQTLEYIDYASQAAGLASSGALHFDGTWRRLYDGRGALSFAWSTDRAVSYLSDGLGERYWTQSSDAPGNLAAVSTLSDGLRPETTREQDWSLPSGGAWSITGRRAYALGPLPDERLMMMQGSGSSRVVTYPHTDRRGSTLALSRAGDAVQTFAYDAFGQGRPSDGPDGYAYRYTGQRLDPWTGSYHYKAREYAPRLGRFYQPDPALFVDGPNVYAYVGNGPLILTDPWGMQEQSLLDRFLSAVSRPETPEQAIERGADEEEIWEAARQTSFYESAILAMRETQSAVADETPRLGEVIGLREFIREPSWGSAAGVVAGIVPFGRRATELPAGDIAMSRLRAVADRWLEQGAREVQPGRWVSRDGARQFRYGSHETRNPTNRHAHFEAYQDGRVIENSVVRVTDD